MQANKHQANYNNQIIFIHWDDGIRTKHHHDGFELTFQ